MDLKDVYIVNGYINENGIYEEKPDIDTYIAECKIEDSEGYSYFAFQNYNKVFKVTNNDVVRVRELMSLINNPNIDVIKIPQEELEQKLSSEEIEKIKDHISVIIENSQGYNSRGLASYFKKNK